jgi:hypothetical protein
VGGEFVRRFGLKLVGAPKSCNSPPDGARTNHQPCGSAEVRDEQEKEEGVAGTTLTLPYGGTDGGTAALKLAYPHVRLQRGARLGGGQGSRPTNDR